MQETKAETLGVNIISEKQFEEMINYKDSEIEN